MCKFDTETNIKRGPPPPPPDTDKSDPGSKSEGEDEPPQPPPSKRGLGRTPNHLTLRYQHMYGLISQTTPYLHHSELAPDSAHSGTLQSKTTKINFSRFACFHSYICHPVILKIFSNCRRH